MDPINTVFIEGTNEDIIYEFSSLIDQIENKQENATDSYTTEIKALLESKNFAEIYLSFCKCTEKLLKLDDDKLIPGFNLIITCFTFSDVKEFESLVTTIINNILNSTFENGLPKLAMFETLYNSLEYHNTLRYKVYSGMVQIAKKHKLAKALLPTLPQIKTLVTVWSINFQEKSDLYLDLSQALKESNLPKESYEFLLNYLQTFEDISQINDSVLTQARSALSLAFTSPSVLNFETLISTLPVQQLKNEPCYELATIFLQHDVSRFLEFKEKHSNSLPDFDLNSSTALHKIRLLTVATLGTQHLGNPISYSELASAMKLAEGESTDDEVERYVIDVIRAQLVEAKLNQLDRSVTITRATYRFFGQDQWRQLDEMLHTWNGGLDKVVAIVQNSIKHKVVEKLVEAESKVAEEPAQA